MPTGTITDNRLGSGQLLLTHYGSAPFDKTVTPNYAKYDYIITYMQDDGTNICVVSGVDNYTTLINTLQNTTTLDIEATDTAVGAASVFTELYGHHLTIMAVPKFTWIIS